MCDHDNREAAMVVLDPGTPERHGRDGVWCDPCFVPLIRALNEAGMMTAASCCGHGKNPGWVMLHDGRDIVIYPSHEANLAVNDPKLLASIQQSGESANPAAGFSHIPEDRDAEATLAAIHEWRDVQSYSPRFDGLDRILAAARDIPEDREPQPTDGPDYHAEHAAWEAHATARTSDLCMTRNGSRTTDSNGWPSGESEA